MRSYRLFMTWTTGRKSRGLISMLPNRVTTPASDSNTVPFARRMFLHCAIPGQPWQHVEHQVNWRVLASPIVPATWHQGTAWRRMLKMSTRHRYYATICILANSVSRSACLSPSIIPFTTELLSLNPLKRVEPTLVRPGMYFVQIKCIRVQSHGCISWCLTFKLH